MATLTAKELTINDVHQLLKWDKQSNNSLSALLSLESLTEFEQQELSQISQDFNEYLSTSKVSEGLVEENIAPINIEDEDTIITGRMDILCVNKEQTTLNHIPFWILVIEAKNSLVAPRAGLAQLLTYAYKSLDYQQSVWGLSTNGELYQFIHLQRDNQNNPNYQLLPPLTLLENDSAIKILQALKAICKLQVNE